MYDHILVPVDLGHTERANDMFSVARKVCAPGGRITVVHVVPVIPAYIAAELPGDYFEAGAHRAHAELEKLVSAADLDAEVIVATGTPPEAILKLAKDGDADLILVASHKPGFADYLLGSTASRVVRHARCSVLVMR